MTEETVDPIKKSEKPTNRSRVRPSKRDRVKLLNKVVIRRLPPSMSEETFLEQIGSLPENENFYYVPADWSLGHDATCRAYIHFINQEDIFSFKDRFDGYVFVDSKGAEYPAIVEFAPFQGLPRNKSRKKDPKCNTIETDPHYICFLENLSKEETEGPKAELKLEYSYQIKNDKKITSTPLLQYLANKKQERRDERKRKIDDKRRQREEDRQRKKNQVTKNIPQAIKEEETKEDDKDRNRESIKRREREISDDLRKDSRNRRKTERDQKRRQEREKNIQKRQEEKLKQETKDKDEDDKKKKETKKYSQTRREKIRSREETKKPESTNIVATQSGSSLDANIAVEKMKVSDEISESVKEFIKSVANCKEFIPRNREITIAKKEEKSTLGNDNDTNMAHIKEKLEQLALTQEKDKLSSDHDKITESRIRDSSSGTIDRNEKLRERERERENARRIRNKDRPSIEIYQPGRMRMNTKKEDGRSSTELKDYKSNPTSDCESSKKEKDDKVSLRKKVSRYSERRSGRVKDRTTKEGDSGDVLTEVNTPNDQMNVSEHSSECKVENKAVEVKVDMQ